MLTCHIIKNPDQKKELIENFLNQNSLWLVSNLQSQYELRKKFYSRDLSVIEADRILRVGDFWLQQLMFVEPQYSLLPASVVPFFVEKWMEEDKLAKRFGLSPKSAGKVYGTLGQILPLISHCHGAESMVQWFKNHREAKDRWFHWYQLCLSLWEKFREKKIIPKEWARAVLLNHQDWPQLKSFQKFSSVIFDLDLVIDSMESELMVNLSRQVDVDVIVPETGLKDFAYREFMGFCQVRTYEDQGKKNSKSFCKYPSMLSEVKEVVSRVRVWLDEGVCPDQIGIVSPIIEDYWPTLSEFLDFEGIPVNKALITPLSLMETPQIWLSKIRLALGRMTPLDGQQVFFCGSGKPDIEYKIFKKKFENIYESEDFDRLDSVKKSIPKALDPGSEVSFEEFIDWTFPLLPVERQRELAEFFSDFDELRLIDESLSFEKWLRFFEKYFSTREKKIFPPNPNGIFVLSLSEAVGSLLTKVFVLGLSEDSLTKSCHTVLKGSDVESIKSQFGFNLPHTDDQRLLKQMEWFSLKQADEMILSCGETDFSGQFQTPSLFWLKGAGEEGKEKTLLSPSKTRWDEAMEADPSLRLNSSEGFFDEMRLNSLRQKSSHGPEEAFHSLKSPEVRSIRNQDQQVEEDFSSMENFKELGGWGLDRGIKRDRGELYSENIPLEIFSLSASSIEEYFKCPFRFFGKKKLHLDDTPSLDLDIDPMSRGTFLHSLCKKIVEDKNFSLTEEELGDLVEKTKEELKIETYSKELWEFQKTFYTKLTQNFMESEIERSKKYPLAKNFALEKKIEAKMKITEKGFCFSEDGEIPFTGFIDRIDYNGDDQFAVIDYKTGQSGLFQFGSWLRKGRLQILLYSLALMDGVLDGKSKNVVAGFYFILKTMKTDFGFFSGRASPDFLRSGNKTGKNNEEKIKELFPEARKRIGEILLNIKRGQFQAQPRDFKACEKCHLNHLCRASHLNN